MLEYIPGIRHNGVIPNEFVSKKIILRFKFSNSADTAVSVWFFPGFFYTDIQLYREKEMGLQSISPILPAIPDSIGYRLITLPAKDSATIASTPGQPPP